jgi:hypothetical protein
MWNVKPKKSSIKATADFLLFSDDSSLSAGRHVVGAQNLETKK